jgi:hypothetical protein
MRTAVLGSRSARIFGDGARAVRGLAHDPDLGCAGEGKAQAFPHDLVVIGD